MFYDRYMVIPFLAAKAVSSKKRQEVTCGKSESGVDGLTEERQCPAPHRDTQQKNEPEVALLPWFETL